jgi:dTDP-4-amino-4,6-dideoxygalactose transaminase
MIPRRKAHIIKKELFLSLKSILDNDRGLSAYKDKWQDKFAHFIGTKYAISVNSGRQGLKLILESLELNAQDEVIIPAYTLKELINIIESLGLRAVPADIDPQTFNVSAGSILKRINKKTKVILATHIFGAPCPIDEIVDLARPRSIFVVEDCAHSLGSRFKGCPTGSFADAAFFSLETIKPVNTYGGGMIVTNHDKIADKIRNITAAVQVSAKVPFKKMVMARLENCFLPTPLYLPLLYLLAWPYWHKKIYSFYRKLQGLTNAKGDFCGFQAFIGIKKLDTLEQRISQRSTQALLLKSLLSEKIKVQHFPEGSSPNYYFFVSLLPGDIWKARKFLLVHGVDAGIEAEIADNCGKYLGWADCCSATEVFRQAIQIPLHEGMSETNIRYVAKVLNKLIL